MIKTRHHRKKLILFLIITFTLLLPLNVRSEGTANEIIIKASSALVKLKLMVGDEKGNLKLNDNLKRCEFVTLVNRMMMYDINEGTKNDNIPFTDVNKNHWAYSNINTAISYGLINGYTDNTFRPDNNVTFVEAQAVLLRALGYKDEIGKNWPDDVIKKSSKLRLDNNLKIDINKPLTRGEAAVLVYNALTIDFKK